MISAGLDDAQRQLLADERRLLAELRDWLVRLSLPEEDLRALGASLAQLEEPFLLVVVGEFNAGKSAFINALLGQEVVEEGVTPTTARIGLLRHGESVSREVTAAGLERITAPAEVLEDIVLVDTPGTNAVLREHEVLTREFVPRADLVLFITSADRPFTESERGFLQAIREWGKKVVMIVNKADLLEREHEVTRVVDYVREQAVRTLGFSPEVFPLSARRALRARLIGDDGGLQSSGFPAFEAKVTESLDEDERFRLKLLNPLGVGRRVQEDALALVEGRLALLEDDVRTLEAIGTDLAARSDEMAGDFRFRLSDVEKVLLDFEKRGNAFFDERLRLSRIRELLNRDRLRRDFEEAVVSDLPRQVERRVEGMVDWMVGAELRQWQDVMARLAARQATHAGRLVGRVDERFEYDRQRTLDAVGELARQAVDGYDGAEEARRLARAVRDSVAQTALLQVSAIGLGAMVAALASTTAADVTGLAAAGALSVIGFLILPARRRQARAELQSRVAALREKLVAALTDSFERERARAGERIREATSPYSRFVRSETTGIGTARTALKELGNELARLSHRAQSFGRAATR